MAKIGGKYEQLCTERLLKQINSEGSITKRHHLISRYLHQREKQVEKIIANIEEDDIDLSMVIDLLILLRNYSIGSNPSDLSQLGNQVISSLLH